MRAPQPAAEARSRSLPEKERSPDQAWSAYALRMRQRCAGWYPGAAICADKRASCVSGSLLHIIPVS